jgi:cytochrome bd-type quinol oxidase subunit 1
MLSFAVAFAIAYFHWIGLIVGGLVAAFSFRNLKHSILAGFIFGLVVWLLFAAYMGLNGLIEKYTSMGLVFYLSLIISSIIPTLTASVKGLLATDQQPHSLGR